ARASRAEERSGSRWGNLAANAFESLSPARRRARKRSTASSTVVGSAFIGSRLRRSRSEAFERRLQAEQRPREALARRGRLDRELRRGLLVREPFEVAQRQDLAVDVVE